MVKKLLFIAFVLSGFITLADNNIILKIGNDTITEDNVKLKEIQIENLFKQKYHRLPDAGDQELINAIEFEWKKKKLVLLLYKIIKENIKSRYYDKVVTPVVINQYIKEHKGDCEERIKSYAALLAASDYIKESTEKDKFRIAYDKYNKMGMMGSYEFFKNNIEKEHYIKFIKEELAERTTNSITNAEKDRIFEQRFPDYIVNELGEKDKEIKEHSRLSEKHGCNYKDILYIQWFIDQGNKMGVEIFDLRYGNVMPHSLRRI